MRTWARICLLLVAGCGLAAAGEKAEWTILLYSAADNDLEWCNIKEVEEYAGATASDEVNIVVLIKRSEKDGEDETYTAEPLGTLGDFTDARRFSIRDGKYEEIEDLGDVNMGDPQTFVDFMAWGAEHHPAERYMAVFGDHGAGYPGFGCDESHDNDHFTLDEIGEALEGGCKAAGVDKIDLIFWDCCSMADMDVAAACAPYGRYMVASREVMPGEGTDTNTWLSALAAKPTMDAEELGRLMCDSYETWWKPYERARDISLCVVDLGKIPEVVAAADHLAHSLVGHLSEGGMYDEIAQAALATENEGSGDFHFLVQQFEGCGVDGEVEELRGAIEAAVVHDIEGASVATGRGFGVFFPSTPDGDDPDHSSVCFSDAWSGLIEAHMAVANGDEVPPELVCEASDDDLEPEEVATVTATTPEKEIAECCFVLAVDDGGKRVIIGRYPAEPEKGSAQEHFDGSWLSIGDAQHQIVAPIERYEERNDKEDVYFVEVPVDYQGPHGGGWQRLTLRFEVDWSGDAYQGTFLGAYTDEVRGDAPLRVQEGGKVRPVYIVINGKGEEEPCVLADAPELVVGKQGIGIVSDDLPPGTYQVGYMLKDYGGNLTEKLVPIRVR